jgi:hypothetical protein
LLERRIVEEPDRFAVQAEAAELLRLIFHMVFFHTSLLFPSELDRQGAALSTV